MHLSVRSIQHALCIHLCNIDNMGLFHTTEMYTALHQPRRVRSPTGNNPILYTV